MAPPVLTPAKALTPVPVLLVGLGLTVKPELPTNVPIIFALMGALAKVLGSTIILVSAPWDFMENTVNWKLKLVQICHAKMVPTVLIHQLDMSANVPMDLQV